MWISNNLARFYISLDILYHLLVYLTCGWFWKHKQIQAWLLKQSKSSRRFAKVPCFSSKQFVWFPDLSFYCFSLADLSIIIQLVNNNFPVISLLLLSSSASPSSLSVFIFLYKNSLDTFYTKTANCWRFCMHAELSGYQSIGQKIIRGQKNNKLWSLPIHCPWSNLAIHISFHCVCGSHLPCVDEGRLVCVYIFLFLSINCM